MLNFDECYTPEIFIQTLKDDPDLLQRVGIPDFPGQQGILSKETVIISFDDIFEGDYNDKDRTVRNNTRLHGTDPKHIEKLKTSFASGVVLHEPPPAVFRTSGKDGVKPFEMLYGWNRLSALKSLGVSEWAFTVFTFSEDDDTTKTFVGLRENEGLPKNFSKEEDIINSILNLVQTNRLSNNEDTIRQVIDDQFKASRDSNSRNRIALSIMKQAGTATRYVYYTPVEAKDFLEKTAKSDLKIGNLYDPKLDAYGVQAKGSGYIRKEGLVKMVRNWHEYQKPTYFVIHCDHPSKSKTMDDMRIDAIIACEELNKLARDIFKDIGDGKDLAAVAGFLPQVQIPRDYENLQDLVSPKEVLNRNISV